MRYFLTLSSLLALSLWPNIGHSMAGDAKALAKNAVAYLEEVGPSKAFRTFDDPRGHFVDRDLLIFVRWLAGSMVAHGAHQAVISRTSPALTDAGGMLYNKGFAQADYRWADLVDKGIAQKSLYVERVGDYVIGAGSCKTANDKAV